MDCSACTKIVDAWVAAEGESRMGASDRAAIHSPEFRHHVIGCDSCREYLSNGSEQVTAAVRRQQRATRSAEDAAILEGVLRLSESHGLLDEDGQLRFRKEAAPSEWKDMQPATRVSGEPAFAALADAVREVSGRAATLVGVFKLPLAQLAPSTRAGGREAPLETPPHQVALVMPALEDGNWRPEVTLEIRPAEIRVLLSMQRGADRAELAMPHAAIRARDGALIASSESTGLRWLEDGSDRCFLTVWQTASSDEKLEDLVDPTADDGLVIWLS